MVDILTDLQLAEGIITYRRIEKLTANDYGQAVYTKVIDEHQLSREQLQENIDFYNDSPKLMEKIYDEVLTRLNKMQAEIMLMATQQDSLSKILTDSIQKLDSSQRFDHINLVLLALKDTTHSKNDSIPNWNYLEKITIPGFIY